MRDSLSDNIYYSTIKIECRNAIGETSGTAFFMGMSFGDYGKIFLVTNRHVVENTYDASITFHQADNLEMSNLIGEYKLVFKKHVKWQKSWIFHPDETNDLAIFDFTGYLEQLYKDNIFLYYRLIDICSIPSKEDVDNILALEQVTFVGYPNGLKDTNSNLPIARKGYLATPLHENFCGKPDFLIDAGVFPGSSGSPVFIYNDGTSFKLANGNSFQSGFSRFWLIGVVYATTLTINNQYLNLGMVIKSEKIRELIDYYLKL